jgi:hypothetical protein
MRVNTGSACRAAAAAPTGAIFQPVARSALLLKDYNKVPQGSDDSG